MVRDPLEFYRRSRLNGALGIAVALVAIAVTGGANVPQEATKHRLSRYHRHQGRGNEERKPEQTFAP